jgi:hypothetical protein
MVRARPRGHTARGAASRPHPRLGPYSVCIGDDCAVSYNTYITKLPADMHFNFSCPRCWIVRAFLHSGISQTFNGAVHYLHNALEVIKRGREIWADEPDPVRGTIFSESFELGVRRMYCSAYFQVRSHVHVEMNRADGQAHL